jgi:hypothetical protein
MAQSFPGVVDMAQNVVLAAFAQNFFGLVAGQARGAFVPIENPPLPVHKVDTIADIIQQLLIECGIGLNNRVLWILRFDKSPPNALRLSYPARTFGHNEQVFRGPQLQTS